MLQVSSSEILSAHSYKEGLSIVRKGVAPPSITTYLYIAEESDGGEKNVQENALYCCSIKSINASYFFYLIFLR